MGDRSGSADPSGRAARLEPGAAGHVDHVVTATDTARALGSGDVDVLGTPRLLALLEAATLAALAGRVDAEHTTVGVRVELDHLAASPVGTVVRAQAWLDSVHGRRLVFHVRASDGERLLATGVIVRALVRRDALG